MGHQRRINLILNRVKYYSRTTVGTLSVNDEKLFHTVEDTVRAHGIKVSGETAIPEGEYIVKLSMSSRFQRMMPMIYTEANQYEIIKGGINFKGVRIHRGNTHIHTHGCVLVGMGVSGNTITQSKKAETLLMSLLEDADEIKLMVIN